MALPDPAEKRRLFERLSSVREVVFGMQDGVLTTAGVLAGLSGAVSSHSQVVLAALASTAAGALSMGAGAYLGTNAESEVLQSELARARSEIERQPYLAQEALLDQLEKEGLSREAGYRVVRLLSSSPQTLLSTAEVKIFGLSRSMLANATVDGLVMGVAFAVGALFPLLPYIFISSTRPALVAALAATAVVLFGVGYFEGWLARRTRWRSGLRFLLIALGAAAVGYLIGLAISPLGGTAG
ncbi:MAG TPA: VIT1/CCC1 transporter family protein [Candidatus Binataceae bacterium]|nr:VIT1/CCC1 transporter family protein [Candidatus Binataceae bacterium]